jgi:ATP-dependent Clp protease ATP-binding subunit ClpA
MNVTELLQFVDQVVQKQTGEHLDDLEKAILKGLWQGQTYNQIADESGYNSQNYIGDVSRKLFKILSEQLGEDINKSNFCWTIERLANSYNNSLQQVSLINNSHINWCSNNPQNSSKDREQDSYEKSYHELTIAPKITHFYGRETELQTLSHWLINQNTRLISILGLPGIGKTTLVKKFVDLNLQNFNIIIWKNIKFICKTK